MRTKCARPGEAPQTYSGTTILDGLFVRLPALAPFHLAIILVARLLANVLC